MSGVLQTGQAVICGARSTAGRMNVPLMQKPPNGDKIGLPDDWLAAVERGEAGRIVPGERIHAKLRAAIAEVELGAGTR